MMARTVDFSISSELRRDLGLWRQRVGIAGIAGALLTAIGIFLTSPNQFYHSYLWSYIFIVGISLGSVGWLMLQYLTGGAWGLVIRRPCEAAARTVPLVVLMFVPVLIGMNNLYPWVHAAVVAADPNLQHKRPYLNLAFFLIRAAIYLGGWSFLARFFNRWSLIEDGVGDARGDAARPHAKMATLAGPGLVFWGFSITFMAIDWILSLNPKWFSTIFGLLFIANQALTSLAFLIALMVFLSYRRPMSEILTVRHLHDLGKLLLAVVMVWGYFAFSQFLIIWAGNLPEEIPWYLTRLNGGWEYVGLAVVLGHFALPFALLLSRDLKRNFKLLAAVAVFILLMRCVDLYWVIAPDFSTTSFHISWMDFTAPVGLIGIWLAYFLTQLEKQPLMPLHDPHLEEALEHGR